MFFFLSQFDKIFEPYTKYCLEQDLCQDYIRSITKENELFRIYIQVCVHLEFHFLFGCINVLLE